jgi:anti-anti-sigma regulatory factor
MLKIQRSANGKVVFTLSGRIEAEDVTELQRLLELEPVARHLVLDLEDVTLADRGAVTFLMRCEQSGIRLENCPPYIREWIERERGTQQLVKRPSGRKRSANRHSE